MYPVARSVILLVWLCCLLLIHECHAWVGNSLLDCSRRRTLIFSIPQKDDTKSELGNFFPQQQHHQQQQRRSFLHSTSTAAIGLATTSSIVLGGPSKSFAAETASSTYNDLASVKVTDRVVFNVRISRSDGTFYVRDSPPASSRSSSDSISSNNAPSAVAIQQQSAQEIIIDEPFYAKLTLELFGDVAPQTVAKFKSYLPTTNNNSILDDNPPPTFARSTFPAVDPMTGCIVGGRIPGLELTTVGTSGTALQYGGRLLPAPLWLEPANKQNNPAQQQQTRLSHTAPGLLTHKVLEPLPLFGITTAVSSPESLDGTHVVFGRLVLDAEGNEFLQRVTQLPIYQTTTVPTSDDATVRTAQAVFRAQQGFFQQTAKALGDTRIDKVYAGKLLRRVEVTQVQVL